jgi:capsular exopolysaccharide synthesis family protein
VALDAPRSPAAESYRSLRTSLEFIRDRQPLHVILITSTSAREGKSTTVANLAATMAHAGRQVAVVDLDLRRPRIHEFFAVSHETGLTSVLLGEASLEDALVRVPASAAGSLWVLPSGPLPPNPSEVLGSDRVRAVLEQLRSRVDYVLLDATPVLPVTDAIVASRFADGVILTTRVGVTSMRRLTHALEQLRQADAPVLGTVVNEVANPRRFSARARPYDTKPSYRPRRRVKGQHGGVRASDGWQRLVTSGSLTGNGDSSDPGGEQSTMRGRWHWTGTAADLVPPRRHPTPGDVGPTEHRQESNPPEVPAPTSAPPGHPAAFRSIPPQDSPWARWKRRK